jgi:hypothetical protein
MGTPAGSAGRDHPVSDDTIKVALLHEIQQDVKQILRQQELGQVLVREVADERMTQAFEGRVANILVYLHATEMSQSSMAPTLNKRFAKYNLNLTQPKISGILNDLRKKGFLAAAKQPAYSPGWEKFLLSTYLRRQLPAALRAPMKTRLDRLKRI